MQMTKRDKTNQDERVHFRCDRSLLRRLDRLAEARRPRVTRSHIVKDLLYRGVEAEEQKAVG